MKKHFLYSVAFIEGCYVLAVELLGAKMITAYYGSSLMLWTAVLGVTLTFLTIGYFAGGKLSNGKNTGNKLFAALMIASLLISLMPLIATPLLKTTYQMNIYSGVIVSAVILIGLPLIMLGTVSPLLIQSGTNHVGISGKISGMIYAVSTFGGIIFTFLLGFYIIPEWGITKPAFFLAFILCILSVIFFFDKNKIMFAVIFMVMLSFEVIFVLKNQKLEGTNNKLVYESEGMLGQLKVVDNFNRSDMMLVRLLLVNGIPQTNISNYEKSPFSNWNYVHYIGGYSSLKPPGSDAVLFGFGGGSIASEFVSHGFNLDVVELDKRMLHIASNYFYFKSLKTNFIIDDARHYLQITKKKYDLIALDLLNGEVQPSYVFSIQSFRKMKEVLKDDGMIIIEYQGYMIGDKNKGVRAVYKTLNEAGFYTYYKVTGANESKEIVDVIYIASKVSVDFSKLDLKKMSYCCQVKLPNSDIFDRPINTVVMKTDDVMVLDDNQPILENYNASSIIDWRKTMIEGITNQQLKQGLRLFK